MKTPPLAEIEDEPPPSRSHNERFGPDLFPGGWAFDELMTAQPDAAQIYFRARLAAGAPKPDKA